MLFADHPFVTTIGVLGIGIASRPLLVAVGAIGYERRAPERQAERLKPQQVEFEVFVNLIETTEEQVHPTR